MVHGSWLMAQGWLGARWGPRGRGVGLGGVRRPGALAGPAAILEP